MIGRGARWFAAGAALAFLASRVMPPMAGRAIGAARVAAGGDPFDALASDHRFFLDTLDAMAETADGATLRRNTLLLRLKRALTAHALAEEDVLYPLLHQQASGKEAAERLYREHAEIKMRLYAIEHAVADDASWREEVRGLRALLAAHARDEEETEFPRLREALSASAKSQVSSEMQREKEFVL